MAIPDSEADNYPGMKLLPMTGMPGYKFGIPLPCLTVWDVAPALRSAGKKGEKALVMTPADTQQEQQQYFELNYKYMDNPKCLPSSTQHRKGFTVQAAAA